MPIKYNSIVVGAGLAGLFAAYLLNDRGRSVCVIAKGFGNLYSSNGCIDKMEYSDCTSSTDIIKFENHPYTRIGIGNVEKAFSVFLDLSFELGIPYAGTFKETKIFPNAIGSLRTTCLYPQTMAKDIYREKEIIVLGIDECNDFHAKVFSEVLSNSLSDIDINYTSVSIEYSSERQLNTYDIANIMGRKGATDVLCEKIKKIDVSGKLLIIPAILSINNSKELIEQIERECNCRVLEIPTLPPSVQGIRLNNALIAYLKRRGVKFLFGCEVVSSSSNGQKVQTLNVQMVDGVLDEYSADAYILAGNGVLSEGIVVDTEPILDDILLAGRKQVSLLPIEINNNMKTNFSNLYAVGSTLKDYNLYAEKGGSGVSLASSYKAVLEILGPR